jgi:hypothetical protein
MTKAPAPSSNKPIDNITHQLGSHAMTSAPAHPPVHSYSPGKDPIEIVDTAAGQMERWRADALLVGETSALTAISVQVRNDAADIAARQDAREAELNARDDAISARERAHAVNATQFVDFVGKASVLFDRLQKARADAEREPIAHPPNHRPGDPSDPSKLPEPSLELEGDAIAGTAPGVPSETDSNGEFLRLKYSVSTDTDAAAFPDPELPHPPEFQQPIAAGLDEDNKQEASRGQ